MVPVYPLTTPNYFCSNYGVLQFEIIMLAFSVSFEYLCYGSTAVRNIIILSVQGSAVSI